MEGVGSRIVSDDTGIAGSNPEAAVRGGQESADIVIRQRGWLAFIVNVIPQVIAVVPGETTEGGDPKESPAVLRESIKRIVRKTLFGTHYLEIEVSESCKDFTGRGKIRL